MQSLRWVNRYHPQTLNIGVILLYIDAVFSLLGGAFGGFGLLLAAVSAGSALGIANDKKIAWYAGVAVSAIIPFFLAVHLVRNGIGELFDTSLMINAIFPIAQFAALVHPMSRSYTKLYFE